MLGINSMAVGYGLAVIFAIFFARTIITGLTCSTRHLPGPWHTRFTHYVLKLHIILGRRVHYVHFLHHHYGPVVRIAPNEVAIADPEGFLAIHKIGAGFLKSPWYNTAATNAGIGLFSMINPKQHAARRKLFARAFTSAALRRNWEPVVRVNVEKAVERITTEALNGKADVLKWWTLMATDIIAELSFGESFQMIEKGQTTEYIKAIQNSVASGTLKTELPVLYYLSHLLPVKSIQTILRAQETINVHASKAVTNLRRDGHSANLFGNMLAESESGEKVDLTDEDIKSESADFILAGSDTTSITLTYLVWAVLKRPDLQDRLEKEVTSVGEEFDDAALEKLPLLNAVIDETLRLYGAAPGNLPRTVPPNGTTIAGFFIPEGISVETQAFTLHRHPDVYTDPLRQVGHVLQKVNC
ncbi:putative sterigmatocystin biosynthesis P450 monooxygenase STCB [Colletotrichum liriopes]|uniref:Sterigmatocystin biosynthesis P450 monooxygenase STCB n=1 Tax=Colletotrichum liriopes TaxID=708192 RepID=A0AA37LU48_9PEZI|nr:putative sterigmatocystin biosynthesis P450 monooxygenase STCB [Colletotrichum liriopes]